MAVESPDRDYASVPKSSSGEKQKTKSRSSSKTKATQIMKKSHTLQEGFAELPQRPDIKPDPKDFGDNVRELTVLSNSFEVTFDENWNCKIFKYDVKFLPELQEDAADREEILRNLEPQIREKIGDHALDNARIYSWGNVNEVGFQPSNGFDLTYELDHGKVVKVTFIMGQVLQLEEIETQYQQQIGSVMLVNIAKKCRFTRMGRNHYDRRSVDRKVDLSMAGRKFQGVTLYMMDGFRMSLEYTTRFNGDRYVPTISLTVDPCTRVLEMQSVQEHINRIQNRGGEKKKLVQKEIIKDLKYRAVITNYNNKIYKINGIKFGTKPSECEMDDPETGKKYKVSDWYKEKYNLVVKDHQDPVLLYHELPARKRDGGRTRLLFLIPELCTLTGYPQSIRRDATLMKKISRTNKIPSSDRAKKARDCALRLSKKAQEESCPLRISPKNLEIQGRMLAEAEMYLAGSNNRQTKTQISKLQMDWKKQGMFNQTKLGDQQWGIVFASKDAKKAKKLVSRLKNQTKAMGRNVLGQPVEVPVEGHSRKDKDDNYPAWRKSILEVHQKYKLRAYVVILPVGKSPDSNAKQKADKIYNSIKEVCSKDLGVASQCIQLCNVDTSHVQIGVVRQLFTKLGSLPWKLKFNLFGEGLDIHKPTMLVGIDVNHDRKESQSPIAYVSSYDRDFVRYHSQLAYHQLADEVMPKEEAYKFTWEALKNFHDINKCYPKQIIVYRDGIASTQIKHVQNFELPGFQQALEQVVASGGKEPKLEFILVNKRVNSRFVCAETYQNVPKGLIVDDVVCSSQYWDFYLNPADAPAGCTSTPTKFIVVRDDLGLSTRQATMELEAFTKQLCNLYYNWPGPVRVPGVVKNADKLTTQFGSAVNGSVPHGALKNTYHFL